VNEGPIPGARPQSQTGDAAGGPLVSVVIPVHNGEAFAAQCLDSVFRQTHRALEVIVVDDGSTDGTGALLDRYPKPIRAIHTEHRNLPSARNRGIAEASGEFIAFLDADDLWLPEKTAKQIEAFRRLPGAGLVCTDIQKFPASGRRPSKERIRLGRKLNRSEAFPLLARRNFITPSTVMVRASVAASAGGFDETLNSCEDWEYWLRLAGRGVGMAFLDEPLVLYRSHASSMSRVAIRMHEGRLAAVQKAFQPADLPGSYRALEPRCLARVHYESSNAFFNAGETGLAEACFRKAWSLSRRDASWKALRRHIRILFLHGGTRGKGKTE
jgi:glycosyltransferase involved in cell wall biosynthesis